MVYFLIGPTASGKTKISINLAKKLDAEIISCDSMCFYKHMDILTSKPAEKERNAIKHHLIDIIPPAKPFNVAQYRELALAAIEDILSRDKTPLFVGGSGLYVKAVVDGLFPSAAKDEKFRKRQAELAERYGLKYLHKKLMKIDPKSADEIHPNNVRRVIRALEIYHTEKKTPSQLKKLNNPLKHNSFMWGVAIDRESLYERINSRVEEMFDDGVVDEVRHLLKMRLSVTAKNALGYNEVLSYLKGNVSLKEAKELLKKNTRNLAKRQMTWFRADKRIQWKKRF